MRTNIEKLLVHRDYTIKEAMKVLDAGAKGIALAVDKNKRLLGTVTDGDIRRAILKRISIDEPIDKIINYKPIFIFEGTTREETKDIFIKKAVKQLPVVNKDKVIVDMISINDILLSKGKENPVVIMAGGLGSRLKDLTREIPKPMLKVGQDPILYHTINNFKQYGYNKFIICVNYKAEIIENYFQDGYAYGVKIEYIKEEKRLGTAGGIRLARGFIDKPFFVINGDIFTNLNLENLMEYHLQQKCDLTVATKKQSTQIPYGVVKVDGNSIISIEEKPVLDYFISAGIYCLNPKLINYIPEDSYFEITDLINLCISKGMKVGYYEIKDYWIDIGHIEDYYKVNQDVYEQVGAATEGDRYD